ncbi:MAG: hypothetical protein AVO34_01695 [Firmicutes bacterium ML8_F2]|jgi:hypothetical protein|nr:MAG: hypothetical protein AVO34_01695 [Firmicutes bacterium ML8_F2]
MKLLKDNNSLLKVTFWALIVVFLFIICQFFVPQVRDRFMGSEIFLMPFGIFFLLGIILILLALKKGKSLLKKFLLLTGISASGFFIGVFLHNAFYALAVLTKQITVLRYLMELLHESFFLLGTLACPLGFLVGAIGSIVLFVKNKEE